LSLFTALLKAALSCGDLVVCHRLRSFLFSTIFRFIGWARVFMGEWVWGGWVEFQAACWMVWTILNICVKNQQIHQLFIQLAFHAYFYWGF
jgi:hypothetical protein